jgi:uncharacterized protein with HEPN domain
MHSKLPKLLLDGITAIELALSFIDNATLDDYCNNAMLRSAVERQLEILGEACSRIGKLETTETLGITQLSFAAGLRNRIIHGYDAVDDDIVYSTVLEDLPYLKAELSDAYERLV